MQTFRDLLSAEHTLRTDAAPQSVQRSAEIPVPGRKKLRLPKSLDGFGDLKSEPAEGFPEPYVELLPAARLHLLAKPQLVFEAQPPQDDEVVHLGGNPERVRTLGARRVIVATAIKLDDCTLYGQAEAIYLANGAGFGSPQLLFYRDRWTSDLSELTVWIVGDLADSLSLVEIRPEANAPHWKEAALLLGGGADARLPAGWKRIMELAAGLYCISLDVRQNPDSARATILGELKRSPPDALLVWRRWVRDSYVYIDTYRSVRPDGNADVIGEHRDSPLNFYEDIFEMGMHLEMISPLTAAPASTTISSWPEAEPHILALECESFRLTSRARDSLAANVYPDPERMYAHLERLSRLAADYAAAQGNFGDRIATIAVAYEIGIALSDDSLSVSLILGVTGNWIDPITHVKVDDAKAADKCGRIYFAIDHENLQFVVDHIGLHDYG
jgi:hypothetical protein